MIRRRRRRSTTALAFATGATLLLAGCATFPSQSQSKRPNIVLFLVDDLGWQDLSEPFGPARTEWNERYETPNVERLCREGTKFDNAYAHCVCSPTRVSLMTGMSAARHRVTHWTLKKNQLTDRRVNHLRPPAWNVNGLSNAHATPAAAVAPTLPGKLRDVGYRTILAGKAHLGAIGTPGCDPRNLGFDVNIAGWANGAPSSYLAEKNFLRRPGNEIWQVKGLERYHGEDLFLTDVLTTESIAAAEQAVTAGQPFFLYLTHYAVHTPLDADDRFVQKYRDRGLPESEARYAALIEGVDHSLGRVLDWLDNRGLADDTIVMFLSDNGGLSAHARAGEPHTHNTPLKSGKGTAYEGGVRVPLAVRWPGLVAADTTRDLPVLVDDVLPTLCQLAGADPACPDGVSFARTLLGGEQPQHPIFWHHPHYWGAVAPGAEPYSGVRFGRFKLLWFYASGRAELYDLEADLGEATDLAREQPEIAQRLRALLRAQLLECGAQVPTSPDGTPLALP
ncbi:MAG: sulfatase [bacterium]|nr:sulfatase [bacterium]